jgi:hypothetical protein
MLDATGMMAADSIGMRVAKIRENKYENTYGPELWMSAGFIREPRDKYGETLSDCTYG